MFSWAERRGIVSPGASPARVVRAATEVARGRLASHQELQAIGKVLRESEADDPLGTAMLWTLMLTGARPNSLATATWDQLQIIQHEGERVGLLVFSGKTTGRTGDRETVVIPPRALAIIEKLPRCEKDQRIFRRNEVPRVLWKRAREAAGAVDLRARDLRRTFASIGFSDGLDKGLIGRLLNHASPATTDVYAKLDVSARARGVGKISKKLDDILGE